MGQTVIRVHMPEEGENEFTFQNCYKKLPIPYIIYADFESLTTKIEGPDLNPTESNSQKTNHQQSSLSNIEVTMQQNTS